MTSDHDLAPRRLEQAVAAALAATGLHASFAGLVREWVLDTRDQWRLCCGSGCDPCVETVAHAVDLARTTLRSAREE